MEPEALPLRHLGTRPKLVAAHLFAILAVALLLLSGPIWTAVLFSLLAGISLGAITSMQGIYRKQLVIIGSSGLSLGYCNASWA